MAERALVELMSGVAERGFALVDGLFDQETLLGLSERLAQLRANAELSPAHIGRGDERQRLRDVRGDLISWLPEAPASLMDIAPPPPRLLGGQKQDLSPAELSFYRRLNELLTRLNRAFFVGIKGFEFHYARYEAGAGYERHSDRFKGSNTRVFSLVTYLNPAWQPAHGGTLKLYLPPEEEGGEERSLVIAPQWGYTICFESARFEHEVLPAYAPRESVTGWLRA